MIGTGSPRAGTRRAQRLRACSENGWCGRLARPGRRPADRNCAEPRCEKAVLITSNRCFRSVRRVAGRHRRVACATWKPFSKHALSRIDASCEWERRRPLSAVLLRRTGLDRCRGRPADAPAAIAYGHRSVIGFCRPTCSARGRTERPGRPVLRSATEGGSRSPFPTASFQLGCWSRGGGGRQACRRTGASSSAEFG